MIATTPTIISAMPIRIGALVVQEARRDPLIDDIALLERTAAMAP
jgi:hypothetical protein